MRQYIINICEVWGKAPSVLTGRAIYLACLSFFVLVVGMIGKMQYGENNFLGLSFCLFVAVLIKVYGIYRMVRDGTYEIVQGMVVKIVGKRRPGRFYKIVLMKEDGVMVELLLDKNKSLKIGRSYRLYMVNIASGRLGGNRVMVFIGADTLVGVEEIGN
ncbi:MAG: hypothetical protein LBT06_07505 [Hungatella sp.]|jgi:hypothetical protein|nr:hypothetical protein [Hungatella sp.]